MRKFDPLTCPVEMLWEDNPLISNEQFESFDDFLIFKFGINFLELIEIRKQREFERKSVKEAIQNGLFWRKGMSLDNLQPNIRKVIELNGNIR